MRSFLSRLVSKKLRRILSKGLLVSVVVIVLCYLLFVQKEEEQGLYEPLSVSSLLKFTEQLEQRTSKGIVIHPKLKCSKHCMQRTVMIVISRASNTVRQNTIRRTWGHPEMQAKYNFCLYFLLGTEENADLNTEISANGDILQVNVIEGYYRLTDKVIEAFNWVTHFCQEARFFFKIDDDVYFDLEFLNEMQKDNAYLPDNVLLGTCKQATMVSRVQSKYYIMYDEYPIEMYPPYCGGPGYVMTLNTARRIYREMLYTKTFKLEDAYLGMVMYRLGIPVKHVDNFIYALDKEDGYMQHFYIRCSRVSHGLTSSNIQKLWNTRDTAGVDVKDCSLWEQIVYMFKYYSTDTIHQESDFHMSM